MAPETIEFGVEIESLVGGENVAGGPVPLEVLERKLTSHAAHLAAAEAEWLCWLGQYCAREGWSSWGCSGPVQWLSWQCGMSPSTAREKVRVAMALRELPTIAGEFGAGRLSYSKVRALTRVATPVKDAEFAELGVAATGAKLDAIVRTHKRSLKAEQGARTAWGTRSWRSRADGEESTVFTFRVPNDHADLMARAIGAEVARMIDDAVGTGTIRASRADVIASRGGWQAMAADAAVALLNGSARTDTVLPAEVEIVVNDDDHTEHGPDATSRVSAATNTPAEALVVGTAAVCCGVGVRAPSVSAATNTPAEAPSAVVDSGFSLWGRALAPTVGQRLCCDPRVSVLIEDARGTVLGAGRKTRLVSRKLRRALERRDRGHCQFPGCAAERRLHAHHIIHWSVGGPTELDNLILVCSFHHHVVHEGGWNVDRTTHKFVMPDATVVDPVPTRRFRGSAVKVTEYHWFDGPAPLAEAENRAFDMGLVLEGLAFDDAESRRKAETCRRSYQPPVALGPPIPLDLQRRRIVEDHWRRNTSLAPTTQPMSNSAHSTADEHPAGRAAESCSDRRN